MWLACRSPVQEDASSRLARRLTLGLCQSPQSGPVCCSEDRLSTRTVDSSSKERMKDELRGVA